ncbi:MAG TPA: cytochrome c [Candidatus Limnocylindria bacterium]|nr:cytochrome c [Candidatus Limnocylindria bacterium]
MRLLALCLALLLAACGEPRASGPIGRGRQVYQDKNCAACHWIDSTGSTAGPDLTHIATVAAARRADQSAEAYIRESITDPGAYIVPGYPDTMGRGLARSLSEEDLAALIAYLLTLK